MRSRHKPFSFALLVAVTTWGWFALGFEASAQGPPPEEGAGPGDEDRGGRSRRRFDPAELMRRMDANGNGTLEPDEVDDRARSFLERFAGQSGIDLNQPIPIDKLAETMRQGFQGGPEGGGPGGQQGGPGGQPGGGRDDRGDRGDRRRDREDETRYANIDPLPKVPGFGAAVTLNPVPGFDVPSDNPSLNQLAKKYDQRIIDRLQDTLRRSDANGNGVLDPEEWKGVPWRTDPRDSDKNHDGRLTREELAQRFVALDQDEDRRRRGGREDSGPPASSAQPAPGNGPGGGETASDPRGTPGGRGGFGGFGSFGGDQSGPGEDRGGRGDRRRRGGWGGGGPEQGMANSDAESPNPSTAEPDTNNRKSYRFRSPQERLPEGLPDWFARLDVNADGQIAMAEYTANWSDKMAADFRIYDKNSDGLISPQECLAWE